LKSKICLSEDDLDEEYDNKFDHVLWQDDDDVLFKEQCDLEQDIEWEVDSE